MKVTDSGLVSQGLLADGVLVPAVVLEIDGIPWNGVDEGGEVGAGHDVGLLGLAVEDAGARDEAGEEPHEGEGEAGAEAGGGFGDKTSAVGTEDAEDLADDSLFVRDDEEEAGDDDGVDGGGGVREGVGVGVLEAAVGEAAAGGPGAGAFEEGEGEVDAGGAEGGVLFGESTGIEAGAAAEFEEALARGGALRGEEGVGDLLGVVAEEVLATEGVEPGTAFEEAVGLGEGGSGDVGVNCAHYHLYRLRVACLVPAGLTHSMLMIADGRGTA